MLENSFGLTFFLKTPRKKTKIRFIYLRITVDGIPKETSTKHKWDITRWDQSAERAIGNKEDARMLNHFLDTLQMKVNQCKADYIYNDRLLTAQKIMDHILGRLAPRTKVLEEFLVHNNELLALVEKEEYAIGTHERYAISRKHVKEFLKFKYNLDDLEFRDLNYEFIKDFELFFIY